MDGARVRRLGTFKAILDRMERPLEPADRTMPTMPAKVTRLELVIIAAVLAILLFSNRPPQPGNAETRTDLDMPVGSPQAPIAQIPRETFQPQALSEYQPSTVDAQTPVDRKPVDLPPEPALQPQTRAKQYAMVDARRCNSLRYPNIMYGEVSVRWVWNGAKFVPSKVCEVRESNGVVSVWNFDDQNKGVTITLVPADQVPMN